MFAAQERVPPVVVDVADAQERVPPESEIPVVSIKVPTGGGKTIIAAHALKAMASAWRE